MNFELTESQIQTGILSYLACRPGMICKIELSGKPMKDGRGRVKLVPFRNKYYRTGMSDIYYLESGKCYWFEVKNVKDCAKITNAKLKGPENWRKKMMLPSWQRERNQYYFLREAVQFGACGGFVCSPESVRHIIETMPTAVAFTDPSDLDRAITFNQ